MADETSRPDAGATATGGAYTVIARRYRPQTFDELIGQEHVARALGQAITSDRVGHAYLFTGARGVGKTSAARVLAKALNCEQGPTPTPCNQCDICLSVAGGDDVDVLEIDGASNRGIDEIRQLRQNVAVRPSRGRYKIYIIDEVHMLTKEAFNALLKTLEEPPEHVKFIFATTEPNKIPITILSRCQRFDFAGIDARSIQARLTQIAENEGLQVEPAAVQILASRAAGSMRDSQSLLEQLLAVAEGTITADDVNSLLGIAPAERLGRLVTHLVDRNAAAALAELDATLAGGVDAGQLLDQLVGYFRDIMASSVGCGPEQLLYALPTQGEEIAALAQRLGIHTVLAIQQILDQTAARLRVSVHTRTLVEMAVVRICNLEDLDELATLVADLKSDGGGDGPAPARAPRASRPAATPDAMSAGAPARAQQSPPAPERPAPREVSPPTASDDSHVSTSEPMTAKSEPPASAIIGELTPAKAREIWEDAARQVGGIAESFVGLTEEVSVGSSGELVVRFKSDFAKNHCEKPENQRPLEAEATRLCGSQVRLRFDLAEAPPAEPTGEPAPRPNRRQMQAEIAERPFVKKALTLFDVEPGGFRYTPPAGEE